MSSSPFQTTQWSLVKRAASPDLEVATAAFSDLYEEYRAPVLRFLQFVPGVSENDAEDIFQDYFLDLKRRGFFSKAVSEKGRLRNFLLKDLNFFLKNRWRKENAQRRGGDALHVSLDDLTLDIAGEEITPEVAFDRQWAMNLLQLALKRMEKSFEKRGKEQVFRAYSPFLSDGENPNHAGVAESLGITESHSRVLLSRLRERWTRTLMEEVAKTVNSSEMIEDEFCRLFAAFQSPKQ